ncbi:MAG: hypothetical protein EXR45_04655 [Chloroflexi bacterium]|nr:hypothetical protein [Chloroflexota bacterium]
MRIATLTPGVRDTVIELGLGDWIVCAPDKPGWHPAAATPHATIAPAFHRHSIDIANLGHGGAVNAYGHPIDVTVDFDEVMRSNPDVILVETECSGCGERSGTPAHSLGIHGEDPQVVTVHSVGLEDELGWIGPIGTLLGVTERAVRLQTVRSARLLALRMHVARYLTQTPGSRLPTVALATYDPDKDSWCPPTERGKQLINAAGGVLISERVCPDDILLGTPDIVLVGTCGVADATSDHPGLQAFLASSVPNPTIARSTWSIAPDFLLNATGPGVVGAVETLLRAIFPDALGANGTPPPGHLLRPVAAR